MSAALAFQQLFHDVLARQVEYSYSDAPERMTTMVPLSAELLARVAKLAVHLPFAGPWCWAALRLAEAIRPDALLLRLDWAGDQAQAITLYLRFPQAPDDAALKAALVHARPFGWRGPSPGAVAQALGLAGPRGIALRAAPQKPACTALYFKCEAHVGANWSERLSALLAACGLPQALAATLQDELRPLYGPGPLGVIGLDEGVDGIARALKFDPGNVPLDKALGFLARMGVAAQRIDQLRAVARGLRADAASYVGAQYGPAGFAGWRLYFACEPASVRNPARPVFTVQRNLRALRRLPHY